LWSTEVSFIANEIPFNAFYPGGNNPGRQFVNSFKVIASLKRAAIDGSPRP
jgi:hypothetical protein